MTEIFRSPGQLIIHDHNFPSIFKNAINKVATNESQSTCD